MRIINAKDVTLTHEKIAEISRITQSVEDLNYRSFEHINSAIKKGDFLLAVDNEDNIQGFLEQSKITGDWRGLFMLYVYPQYRGKGIGIDNLLPHAVSSIKGQNIYAATRKKSIRNALENMGFSVVKFANIPITLRIHIFFKRYNHPKSLVKLWGVRDKGFIYLLKRT